MWPATGRVITVVMHGLIQRELVSAAGPGLLELAQAPSLRDVLLPAGPLPDIDGYVELAAAGGFPEALLRWIAWLRDSLGADFVRGIVLHTGPGVYELGDRLWALPICAMWTGRVASKSGTAGSIGG